MPSSSCRGDTGAIALDVRHLRRRSPGDGGQACQMLLDRLSQCTVFHDPAERRVAQRAVVVMHDQRGESPSETRICLIGAANGAIGATGRWRPTGAATTAPPPKHGHRNWARDGPTASSPSTTATLRPGRRPRRRRTARRPDRHRPIRHRLSRLSWRHHGPFAARLSRPRGKNSWSVAGLAGYFQQGRTKSPKELANVRGPHARSSP